MRFTKKNETSIRSILFRDYVRLKLINFQTFRTTFHCYLLYFRFYWIKMVLVFLKANKNSLIIFYNDNHNSLEISAQSNKTVVEHENFSSAYFKHSSRFPGKVVQTEQDSRKHFRKDYLLPILIYRDQLSEFEIQITTNNQFKLENSGRSITGFMNKFDFIDMR